MSQVLLVGLGNPGEEYSHTRHNAGFIILDALAEKYRLAWSESRFQGPVAKGQLLNRECQLLKPMTFMNRSGQSVGAMARYFKIDVSRIVVIYDDIDVPSGKVKTKIGGSSGGHNGVSSVIAHLGGESFPRIKLGVGKPNGLPAAQDKREIHSWVLGRMTAAEMEQLMGPMLQDVEQRLTQIFAQLDSAKT